MINSHTLEVKLVRIGPEICSDDSPADEFILDYPDADYFHPQNASFLGPRIGSYLHPLKACLRFIMITCPYQLETNSAEKLKRFISAMSWLILSFGSGTI